MARKSSIYKVQKMDVHRRVQSWPIYEVVTSSSRLAKDTHFGLPGHINCIFSHKLNWKIREQARKGNVEERKVLD